ncbi:MAG: 4Fe-4S binding protein [Candidatus Eisenbacteria bacterium]|uniref:4Fe-4S binding protein n=1 Tax=Eiseniibacteriota bacterium TaxID=2212470 RepID=A0A9D6QLS0_UNCEI|nr:4Fe-4S binding protein [Candidatus Eisenbacteria bacterium]
MGGAVPNDGGLTLDLTRLDPIDLDAAAGVAVIGAGARMRVIHQRLAQHGLALRVYPSNLGGTLCGWFVTGGIGMNAFGHGRALDSVRAADLLLPSGDHIRLHDDGRLDVPDEGPRRRTLASADSAGWFTAHGLVPMTLADLAGSEGTFGLVVRLTVAVERRPEIGAFLLSFETREATLEAAAWVTQAAGGRFAAPANVKLLSGSHLEHSRRVWQDEDAREWREHPGALSSGAMLPWTRIAGPAELGARVGADRPHAHGYLYVDFFDLDAARAFARSLDYCPGSPRVLEAESVRFGAERFRPMQTKRLGPGLLAAEIVMPAANVPAFLPAAETLAANAGPELDAEVYYLADGSALVIAAYLTDHRSGAFAIDLLVAPALVDLAMTRFGGRPYVLGRWQAAWFRRRFTAADADRLLATKQRLDPAALLSRGVLFGFRLRGALGAITAASFSPGVAFFRGVGSGGMSGLLRAARGALAGFGGPARGRGEPAVIGATFRVTPAGPTPAVRVMPPQQAAARALHCVNCGECNSVCPIFHESGVRLPQMLTHIGEGLHAGEPIGRAGATLLDLCMRCGNCEEVCQAGIPHLPLYEAMQAASEREMAAAETHCDRARRGAVGAHDAPVTMKDRRERHTAILIALRGSTRYTRQFLDVRAGGYLKRTPASLPGLPRFVLLRAENDEGPAATCIHCGACVGVCPTSANLEFQGEDARWITTDQARCIGCGTCVEVCPANHLNGGQTLRVMEAPTRDWFVALDEIEQEQPT